MKNRKNNEFKKLLLLTGLGSLLMVACQKDPQPEPTPETPVTPVEPKNDTIFWNLTTNPTWGPSAEVVQEHLDKPNTKNVVIHMFSNQNGVGQPLNVVNYESALFDMARYDLIHNALAADSTRTILYVIFEVTNVNATGHGWDEIGITPADKAWFERHGAQFIILDEKKAKTPNHGFTPILPRAITNNGKTR